MNGELLRIVEALHRQKDIDKEVIFQGIEAAVASATRKHFGREREIRVEIDRKTGELRAFEDDEPIDPVELGRIAAQTAKQIMIQKIREAERDVIYHEFEHRAGTIVTGTVQRYEGGTLIVSIDKIEGALTKHDLIPGDSYRPGDTLRAVISEVRKIGQHVQILLSRSSNDFVIRLFELEVPEISEGLVEVKAIARIPGYRTKVAIKSNDPHIDSVGACVGVRGSRIKNIVAELNGEKIDIIEWRESPEELIVNALKPAEISELEIDDATSSAKVIVVKDQLSLAIGKRGQNVKLASRLTGWNLEIVTVEQDIATQEALKGALVEHAGASEEVAMAILGAGYTSLKDIADSVDAIAAIEGVGEGLARSIIEKLKEYLAAHPEAEKPVEVVEIEGIAEVAAEKEAAAEAEAPESAPADQPQETDTEDINLQAEPGEEQEPSGKD